MRMFSTGVFLAALAAASTGVRHPPVPTPNPCNSGLSLAPFDLVIRHARVMDGSGNPWVRADVGVTGDRITAVGQLDATGATRVIDAHDQVLSPGFIDVHSHAAEGITRPALRQAQPLLAQGVTTFVGNPDGGGPVDLAAQRAKLEKGGIGPNVALLIGHGSVRIAVLGRAKRAPSSAELVRMAELVRQGMREGAFGLSSGLFYAPASFATTEEVIALAKVAAEYGGVYTSHIRDEGDYNIGVVAAVDEVIRIADEAHVTGIVSHMKALGPDNWGLSSTMIAHIDRARARGVPVFADQYPYDASSTSLRAALLPDAAAPDAAIVHANLKRRGGADKIMIASYAPDRALEGQTLAQIAHARAQTAEAAAIAMLAKGEASIVSFNMSEADIEAIMRQPYTMASSDGALVEAGAGKPHPRNDGAFARRLAVYVHDRHVVPLEFAIRSMTSLPALVFGIRDRGTIRPGAFADLVIFDPDRIRDRATYTDPQQLATGVSYVLVNGTIVLDDGRFTAALPGRVLRHELPRQP
ncbi:MAG TPA: D-aminoacylase [Vicinamibacterales bacterium]|nr:D-aminoacylase [Vicinamibacterales bacterium]